MLSDEASSAKLGEGPSPARGAVSRPVGPSGPNGARRSSGRASDAEAPRARVLVVDDHRAIRRSLCKLLEVAGFAASGADCVVAARERLAEDRFDIVMLDLDMPGENGLVLLPEIAPLAPHTMVIVATGNDDAPTAVTAMKQGAVDYVCKPYSRDVILNAIGAALESRRCQLRDIAAQSELEGLVAERTDALHKALERLDDAGAAVKRVACALAEIRDAETGAHLRRMAVYARELARALPADVRRACRIDQAYIDHLYEAAPLHDIGKTGIPDRILLKRGPLTAEERQVMCHHPAIGRRILQAAGTGLQPHALPLLRIGMEICGGHHERWDGDGYPQALRGAEIPLSARVIAVADVYDALATSRPYRPDAYPHETVVQMIGAERGGAFDPDVVDAFMDCEAKLAAISQGQTDDAAPAEPLNVETATTTNGAAGPWHGGVFVEAAHDIRLTS